jgi:hypothetical protein
MRISRMSRFYPYDSNLYFIFGIKDNGKITSNTHRSCGSDDQNGRITQPSPLFIPIEGLIPRRSAA